LESLRAVLSEDTKFPATKEELIESQGWKVIDLTKEKRIHAMHLLQLLPQDKFQNLDEVIESLRPAVNYNSV